MSEEIYGWLLNLYPWRFRQEYGDAMRQVFRDRLRTEPRLRLWLDVLRDLAISVPREHRRSGVEVTEPGVYRLSGPAIRKMLSRGHGSAGLFWPALAAGVVISWAGGAPLWLAAGVYSLAALFLLFRSTRKMKRHWRGYEIFLEGDRVSSRHFGVVQTTLQGSEIASIQETEEFGLAIEGPVPVSDDQPQAAIWAPATLTGYAELRERLAAFAPVTVLEQPSRGWAVHRKHLRVLLPAFYVSALLVRSPYWLLGLASICIVFIGLFAIRMARVTEVPRSIKLIPVALLVVLAIKIVFVFA